LPQIARPSLRATNDWRIRAAEFEILCASAHWQIVREQDAAYYVSYGPARRIDTRHPDRLRIVPPAAYPDRPTRFQTDGEMVFVDGLTVPEADPERFRALGTNFGADPRHVFHLRKTIPEADPSSARARTVALPGARV
jgi:hypothetical protein